MNWRKLENEVPELEKKVLVTIVDNVNDEPFYYVDVAAMSRNGHRFELVDGTELWGCVIAWLPLPEPYMGDNSGQQLT